MKRYSIFMVCFLIAAFISCKDSESFLWKKHVVGSHDIATYIYASDVDKDGDLDIVAGNSAHRGYYESEIALFLNLMFSLRQIMIKSSVLRSLFSSMIILQISLLIVLFSSFIILPPLLLKVDALLVEQFGYIS